MIDHDRVSHSHTQPHTCSKLMPLELCRLELCWDQGGRTVLHHAESWWNSAMSAVIWASNVDTGDNTEESRGDRGCCSGSQELFSCGWV
jgi:hypothetical protein